MERFWGSVCLELTGGSLLEEPVSEAPLFLFYFCSVFFIGKYYVSKLALLIKHKNEVMNES